MDSLWVFGYGSLCWLPGFTYGDCVVGHVEGYARRFWQGNASHRGTKEKPGRVATLIDDPHSQTHGVAFQLLGDSALEYLNNREVTLGGYVNHMTTFYPAADATTDNDGAARNPFPVLLFMATPSNEQWLGSAPLEDIAEQVVHSSGKTGHNVEYVLKLAAWSRFALPEIMDDHLFQLEKHILSKVEEYGLSLDVICPATDFTLSAGASVPPEANDEEKKVTECKVDYTNGNCRKCLKCVKI